MYSPHRWHFMDYGSPTQKEHPIKGLKNGGNKHKFPYGWLNKIFRYET